MKFIQKLKEFFSLDYRSLALMRVSMGVLLIIDLIDRAQSLTAHYTDSGVLSRAMVLLQPENRSFLSIHMMSGAPFFEGLLFILAGIFAVMLILGYRTRLATILSWFLLISLHARNPLVLQGGDIIFRCVLFWMMFLPTGKVWSLDRLFGRTNPAKEKTILSAGTFAYIVQIVVFYVFAGLLKTGDAWRDGTAVYYALSVDQLTRPLGEMMRNWRVFDRIATYATLYYETYGSLLYFSPWQTGLVRTIGILLFALMQIGFNSAMHLGIFGPIAIVVTLGMLPSYFWDKWWARATSFWRRRARVGLSIYYDTDCGFCYKMVHVLRRFLYLSPQTSIHPASVNESIEQEMTQKNSWVVVDRKGNHWYGFRALAEVFGYSPIFFWLCPLFLLPGIRQLGEYLYRLTAEKRLLVCLPEKQIPDPNVLQIIVQSISTGLVLLLSIYIIFWNIDTTGSKHIIPQNMEWVAWTTRLDQDFNMFSPTPLTEDGWYVIPATLQSGEQIDLFKDGPMLTSNARIPVSYEKPLHVADGYPDQRWQKYLMNLSEVDFSNYRLPYGQYLCRTWNASHSGPDTLVSFNIVYMIENTPNPDAPYIPAVPTTLWEHHCF